MAYYEIPKAWRPDVGNGCESGSKTWTEYEVDIEYIAHHPNDTKKQYYMRWHEWFLTREEVVNFLKTFEHGEIRQAWINKVVTTKIREQYLDSPHDIEPGCEW